MLQLCQISIKVAHAFPQCICLPDLKDLQTGKSLCITREEHCSGDPVSRKSYNLSLRRGVERSHNKEDATSPKWWWKDLRRGRNGTPESIRSRPLSTNSRGHFIPSTHVWQAEWGHVAWASCQLKSQTLDSWFMIKWGYTYMSSLRHTHRSQQMFKYKF